VQTENGSSKFSVFDRSGRVVKTIRPGGIGPGRHDYTWNLADDRGEHIAAGIYFLRLETGGRAVTHKFVVAE
jgi:hypothetical protein